MFLCPHCKKKIDDKEISAHLGSKGGAKSKRTISEEAQAKLQVGQKAWRIKKQEGKKQDGK